ncbi:MAG: DEAD/DEAH box helicase [Acetobacteraceae bacterium]
MVSDPGIPGLGLSLTPHGRLKAEPNGEALLDAGLARRLAEAFGRGSGHGLLRLGGGEVGQRLSPVLLWWGAFAARYVTGVCQHARAAEATAALPEVPPPDAAECAVLLLTAPLMRGAEYLTAEVLVALWNETAAACRADLAAAGTDLQSFLKRLNPAWNLVGRVHFNLAENRGDADAPFAFLVTYTTRLSAQGRAQHLPLGRALQELAGERNRQRLLSLLLPVQRAAERCAWLKTMVDNGELFHPLRWMPADAARFLGSVPVLESAGVMVRMPASWPAARPVRPQVSAVVGTRPPSGLGLDGLLDFRMSVTLDGEVLSPRELAALLAGTESLVLLRGRWVEVDRERLQRTLAQFGEAERIAARDGLNFASAMRLLAGAEVGLDAEKRADPEWSRVMAGPWLTETLRALREPDGLGSTPTPLNGVLRPYQRAGTQWLRLLSGLGLGACLADDMGLGKTIQVLALLLAERRGGKGVARQPSLLVAPASLLANWAAEIEKFAPELCTRIVHPSVMGASEMKEFGPDRTAGLDLAITTYGSLLRIPGLAMVDWQFVVLDEAQAIKNPEAKQTRAAKRLKARARIALTGTPVENDLGDLWSIFDFVNPGLLGSAKQFSLYAKGLANRPVNPYGPLRELVRPYILRRLKTDKAVIADLPDKTEVKAWCHLSRRQAALYEQAVRGLEEALENAAGIERKGLVLAMLMRLKQICNHPSHWLNDGLWAEEDSGKLGRLREIGEVVASRQEKMLVFTQFREMTEPLAAFLGGLFGRPGLVLHGGTPVGQRRGMVERFQEDEAIPFFVLSLKAGGVGLNLTAASHVVHFDRWWNPAVENQATDRAFRIGQRRNVLVHKFVCSGTVEERIDRLIDSKRSLSDDLLAAGGEINLTEMKDEELLKLVALDLNAAIKGG